MPGSDFRYYYRNKRRGAGRLVSFVRTCRDPGWQAIAVYRLGHWLVRRVFVVNLLILPIYVLLSDLVRICWGIEIGRYAELGEDIEIVHAGGIIIADGVVVGSHARICHGVTIGMAGRGEQCGVPHLGEGVFIGAKASIIGRITVGDQARIGAHALVHKDIPAGAIVACSPGFAIIGNRFSASGETPSGEGGNTAAEPEP